MMLTRSVTVLLLVLGAAQPALAQQTLNVTLGYFSVRSEDARVDDDVIVANRRDFAFDVDEFSGATAGVEWLVPLGEFFEAGAGVGFSRQTVPSVYADFVDRDGSEIEQEFRLRMVPVTFSVRVLPLGQSTGVQPYFGGGLALVGWRYSESGDFIDLRDRSVFREQYVASGSARGPVALGGIRFAGERVSGGFEVRYQDADADLGTSFAAGTPEPRIDLGGWTYQATVGFRFGR
jgi:hypothetical protein